MAKSNFRSKWAKKISQMFPGDTIHSVAPSSRAAKPAVRIASIDEARLKRMRKLQRRAKQASQPKEVA